jgi:hypothetical protein
MALSLQSLAPPRVAAWHSWSEFVFVYHAVEEMVLQHGGPASAAAAAATVTARVSVWRSRGSNLPVAVDCTGMLAEHSITSGHMHPLDAQVGARCVSVPLVSLQCCMSVSDAV